MKRFLLITTLTVSLSHQAIGDTGAAFVSPDTRRYAGHALSYWHETMMGIDPKSSNAAVLIEPLIEIVSDDDLPGIVRKTFADYLARVGFPARKVVPILASLIDKRHNNSSLEYRWAARSLALMGESAAAATPSLVDLLLDDSLPVSHRQSAVEALALIGNSHPDAVPALLKLLQYRESNRVHQEDAASLRYLAAESFFIVGSGAEIAAPLLIRIVRNPRESEMLRHSAIKALGAMETRGVIAIAAMSEELVFGDSPVLRDAAAETIVRVGSAAMPTITNLLKHPDDEVRWRIAFQLRATKTPNSDSKAQLASLLGDESAIVRINAAESALELFGTSPQIVDVALALLHEQNREIRIRAKRVVIDSQPIGAGQLDRLRTMQNDDDRNVGKVARTILKQLHDSE